MKIKFTVIVLAVLILTTATSWGETKPIDLGVDSDNMQWYLVDYGHDVSETPYAIARAYYTNETIKNQTIKFLTDEGIYADNLYFTDYKYEYTTDGKQFSVMNLTHYDKQGYEIISSEYMDKVYEDVPENSIAAKCASYVFGTNEPVGESGGGCMIGFGAFAMLGVLIEFTMCGKILVKFSKRKD